MDNILIIAVLTILITAFVSTIIKYRLRDKCLKEFRRFLVNLHHLNGRRTWGKLNVFHNGIELIYPSPHLDSQGGHYETSYLFYQQQFGQIRAIKRFHDELSEENQKQRAEEIRRTYHPNLFRRSWRSLRNLFNLLRDAVGQAFTVFLGAYKQRTGSAVLATQDARISGTAQQIITQGAAAYEPILEQYIGRKVVLEITHDGKVQEYGGILKEYTNAFVTVLDVPVDEDHAFSLAEPEQLRVNRDFDFEVTPKEAEAGAKGIRTCDVQITFHNKSRKTVRVVRAEGDMFRRSIELEVPEGESVTFEIKGAPCVQPPEPDGDVEEQRAEEEGTEINNVTPPVMPNLQLFIRCRRYMDMIVPRAIGMIRHGGESLDRKRVWRPGRGVRGA